MLKLITLNIIVILSINLAIGQECPTINRNGSFEEMIYVPGGEPSIGITTGQIDNWAASHGTVDFLTPDWNWYGISGISSNAGHLCYGNRESHDHSEGMYTTAKIYGDDDLLYTLSLEYATFCDATKNGFLNIALNNKLTAGSHNGFQYPTPEVLPTFFQEIQAVDRVELLPDANFVETGMSSYEVSFVPYDDFDQLWLFTEFQYPEEDFINCGLMIDNVKLTAMTTALDGVEVLQLSNNNYQLTPSFSKELNVVSYDWSVNNEPAGNTEKILYSFTEDVYTICVDIIDDRGACGSTCLEFAAPLDQDESESSNDICTYSSCLDLGGLPNILSVEFLSANGNMKTLDSNTPGFFFPYCIGTASMCDGGENEIGLLVEDLNAYFIAEGLNSEASIGYSINASELGCRSLAITIMSSDLVPTSINLDDFLSDDISMISVGFDFDSSNCGSSFSDDPTTYLINDESEVVSYDNLQGNNDEDLFELRPKVIGNQISLYHKEDDLLSNGGIYTTSGQMISSIQNYKQGDKLNVDFLTTGMYIVRLVNREGEQSAFFFKG